jgi:hypothetical protein
MPSLAHDFFFDTKFSFGDESVFTLIDKAETVPTPPVERDFLLLNGGNFLLLNGQNLDLL